MTLCFLLGPYVDRMTLTMAGIKEKELTHLSAFFIQYTLDQRARTYTRKWRSRSQSDINPPLQSPQFSGRGRQVNTDYNKRDEWATHGAESLKSDDEVFPSALTCMTHPGGSTNFFSVPLLGALLPCHSSCPAWLPWGKGQESGVDIWGIAPTKAVHKLGIPTCEPSQCPSQNAKKTR